LDWIWAFELHGCLLTLRQYYQGDYLHCCDKRSTSDENILGIRKETRPIMLAEEFCSGFVYLMLASIMALAEESVFSSGWATEATAKVETKAETWCSCVVLSMTMI